MKENITLDSDAVADADIATAVVVGVIVAAVAVIAAIVAAVDSNKADYYTNYYWQSAVAVVVDGLYYHYDDGEPTVRDDANKPMEFHLFHKLK